MRPCSTRSVAVLGLLAACAWSGSARAQTLEPPRVVSLPSIEIPAGVEAPPGGRVEITVVVATDGTATVEACTAVEALCAVVRDAMRDARFSPARRDGVPIPARVRVALDVRAPEPIDAGVAAPEPAQPPDAGAAAAPRAPATETAPRAAPSPATTAATASREPALEFEATARVRPPRRPGMRRLELAETRDLPGAFGDPFRAIDALPGVVPILSGLPYFYVRGSPPAGTLYVYDDIALPALYHLALGPAVIHPRMVGPIQLYSGVAPARYGRLIGGVVVGEGPDPPDGRLHAEAEARLLDLTGYVQVPALGGAVTGAFRYGYPALLLSIFSPEVDLAYWDYQLRVESAVSARDRIEVVGLGAYDSLTFAEQPDAGLTLQFHRLEPRFIRRIGATELGVALLLGYEESSLGSGFQLQAARVGPRVWMERRFGGTARLRLSADLIGVAGAFSSTTSEEGPGPDPEPASGPTALFGDVPARSMWGVQAELGWRPLGPSGVLELQLGARADGWVQGAGAEGVLDPRARAIVRPSRDVDLHVAAGVVHQPAVFFIPLPGIADVATDQGLQTAIQSEAGVGWDAPLDLRAEAQLFLHHYANLVFADVLFLGDTLDTICSTIECGEVALPERIDGYAYGAELFVRRAPEERISGWVSYTLSWSDIDDIVGMPYTPSWDVRHVANVVLQWKIIGGLSAGLRFHARSGKMHGEYIIDDTLQLSREEQRLPWFLRLDLQVAYAWRPSWGRMRVALEWLNATMSREPQDIVCMGTPRTCETVYLPAIFFPNLGVRGDI